jgi:hypothetical protein
MPDPTLLNRTCRCVAVDTAELARTLDAGSHTPGLSAAITANQPHLFSTSPVFVARELVERMREAISAIESVIALDGYKEHVLAWAPGIARLERKARGVFLGYDFHLGDDGPKLIEINTNAGGALLNTALAAAQQACCAEVEALIAGAEDTPGGCDGAPAAAPADACAAARPSAIERQFLDMFLEEWHLARGNDPLRRIAIVDEEPEAQYLHPEFLLFRALFERAGIAAAITDPRALRWDGARLRLDGDVVDIVYNRLTDFALAEASSTALRAAYEAGAAVVTPHPRAHALYADKRNLTVLSDPERLRGFGVSSSTIETLERTVPRTRIVDAARADAFWSERKRLFFKPAFGYGARAAYRGDKLTRGAFQSLLERPYVAQDVVPPSVRTIEIDGALVPLKLDLRNYVYRGRVQLVAARLYQGQTTNFRTPGGGFAPVFTERREMR